MWRKINFITRKAKLSHFAATLSATLMGFKQALFGAKSFIIG